MDFKLVKLKNFRNYSNETVDLEDDSVWILRGKNSSGKSTLACDALTFALFGKIKAMDEPADLRVLKDDIIKRGKTKAQVRIDFSHKGDSFSLTRIREKVKTTSKETVTLTRNNQKIMDEEKKSKADKWIEKNLWAYDDFTNTTLILQDDMTKALQMPKGDRKDYLERLFNIKNFEKMSDKSREKSKILENRVLEISGGVNVDLEKLHDPQDLREKKSEFKRNLVIVQTLCDQTIKERDEKKKHKEEINRLKQELDALEKKSKEYNFDIEELSGEVTAFESELKSSKIILSSKPKLEERLKEILELEEKLKNYELLKEEAKELQNLKHKWQKVIKKTKKDLEGELQQCQKRISENKQLVGTYNRQIIELQEKEQNIVKLEQQVDTLPDKKKEYEILRKNDEEYRKLVNQLASKEAELSIQIKTIEKKFSEKKRDLERINQVKDQLDLKKKSRNELDTRELEKKAIIEKIEVLEEQIAAEKTGIQVLNTKIEDRKHKITESQAEITHIKELQDAQCPRCKQNLTVQHVKEIEQDINIKIKKNTSIIDQHSQEISEYQDLLSQHISECKTLEVNQERISNNIKQLRINSDGIDATEKEFAKLQSIETELEEFYKQGGIDAILPELRKEITDLDHRKKQVTIDKTKLDALEKEYVELKTMAETLKQYRNAVEKLPELQSINNKTFEKLDHDNKHSLSIQNKLKNNNYAEDARKDVTLIDKGLIDIQEKLEKQQSIVEELNTLEPEKTKSQLEDIESKEKRRDSIQLLIKDKKKQIEKQEIKLNTISNNLEDEKFRDLDTKLEQLCKSLSSAEEEYEKASISLINAQRDLDDHHKLIKEQGALQESIQLREKEITQLRNKQEAYLELASIFKKIGGRVLSRLRNRINVETIDILGLLGNSQLVGITLENDFSLSIQTPEGDERPGFFSGGQRVRIGLAFRLALSQVLADFRGNELDTLIIDEGGFGALDQDGQDGIIDVFNAIQKRFQRMLIISHIDAIAENLPGTSLLIENGQIIPSN
ncbi:MAG: AAA family ATPase [Candidatus Kariarchaeaceae archaeon]|jgi:exonuclease SbcC